LGREVQVGHQGQAYLLPLSDLVARLFRMHPFLQGSLVVLFYLHCPSFPGVLAFLPLRLYQAFHSFQQGLACPGTLLVLVFLEDLYLQQGL